MLALTSTAEARGLLHEWVESPSLRRHCEAVAASMRAYAPQFGGDAELWEACGLLHDADYERHPDMDDEQDGHPRTIVRHLRERGAPAEMIEAIEGHAPYLGVPRTSAMAKALFAVDELSGFVVACAAVRPQGVVGMTPKSVKKKLKTPAFAAAVDRDDVRNGAEQLAVDFDEHLRTVIAALEARAGELGIAGDPPGDG